MRTRTKISNRKITGQGMTEYIIIVALIAIAAIGVFTAFGDVVKAQVGTMAGALSGTAATQAAGERAIASGRADTAGTADQTLGNYDAQQ